MARRPRVNNTLFLRSGMSQMLRMLCSISALEDLGLSAEARDPLLRLCAELVRPHSQSLGQVSARQDLHAVANPLDHPPLQEDFRGHDGSGVEDLEALQVDLGELLPESA